MEKIGYPSQKNLFSTTDWLSLLIFTVGGQTYSLPITRVVRIIEMVTIIQLPNISKFIQGMINFQGKAVPVMDLRHRLNFPAQPYQAHTPIILVNLNETGSLLGLIVDYVEEVVEVPQSQLKAITFSTTNQKSPTATYLKGVVNIANSMSLLLNMEALITPTDQALLPKLNLDTVPK